MTETQLQREIREYREAFAAASGYDIRAMFAALSAKPLPPGFHRVTLPPRPAKPLPAPTPPPEAA
jgi:hypothetical protein